MRKRLEAKYDNKGGVKETRTERKKGYLQRSTRVKNYEDSSTSC